MRILHILSEVPDLGNGIVNAAIDLAAGQVEQGHTVVIASAGEAMNNCYAASASNIFLSTSHIGLCSS